jgi:hypothetical protein
MWTPWTPWSSLNVVKQSTRVRLKIRTVRAIVCESETACALTRCIHVLQWRVQSASMHLISPKLLELTLIGYKVEGKDRSRPYPHRLRQACIIQCIDPSAQLVRLLQLCILGFSTSCCQTTLPGLRMEPPSFLVDDICCACMRR